MQIFSLTARGCQTITKDPFPLVPTSIDSARLAGFFIRYKDKVLKCDIIRLHATDWLVSSSMSHESVSFRKIKIVMFETRRQRKWLQKTTLCSPSVTNSYRPSRKYIFASTSIFSVVFVLHINDVAGCADTLL